MEVVLARVKSLWPVQCSASCRMCQALQTNDVLIVMQVPYSSSKYVDGDEVEHHSTRDQTLALNAGLVPNRRRQYLWPPL
jgi:hypothetical protein